MSEDTSRAWKDQYMLRLPDGMRDRIKEAAASNNRSMNAEIVARLEASFSTPLGILNQPMDPEASRLMSAGARLMSRLVSLPDEEFRTVVGIISGAPDSPPDKG